MNYLKLFLPNRRVLTDIKEMYLSKESLVGSCIGVSIAIAVSIPSLISNYDIPLLKEMGITATITGLCGGYTGALIHDFRKMIRERY